MHLSPTAVLTQEHMAHIFTLHAAIPTFMLRNLILPSCNHLAATYIQIHFQVSFELAYTRLLLHRPYITKHTFPTYSLLTVQNVPKTTVL